MRKSAIINLFLGALLIPSANAFEPPIGIPYPAFGIDETHTMYSGSAGYLDAGNGPYTMYVDNSASNCSNSGPATQAQPRCDLPKNLSAGEVVEIHGGPYRVDTHIIRANGTASQPIFIRGIDDGDGAPRIIDDYRLQLFGSYFVFEGFDIDQTMLRSGDSSDLLDHVAIRNNRVHDQPRKNGTHIYGTDVLFWKNEVDHNQGNDRHGTYVGSRSKRIWILDNYYHHNGGDGIQFCHGCTSNYPDTVYIGRNHFHSDRENGVDLKYATNVVISQNKIHSYVDAPKDTNWCFDDGSKCGTFSSGSDGSAVVIGSDGGPTNIWVIFNEIYDAEKAIRIEESGASTYIIGNVIYDIAERGLALEKKGEPVYFVGNTLHDVPKGIDQFWREFFDLIVTDNIFSQINKPIIYETRGVAESSVLDNNIFWDLDGELQFTWPNPTTISSASGINNLDGEPKQGNQLIDPRFIATGSNTDLQLRSNSTAIDNASNMLANLDAIYRSSIEGGTSIMKDFNGASRSPGFIDIGAFEFDGTISTIAPPSAPSSATVRLLSGE